MYRRFRQTRAGQNIVEFALLAPLFFLLVFGIIEGGRLLWTFHTVSNAAKEGARYVTVRGAGSTLPDRMPTNAQIEAYILTKTTGLDADNLSVELDLESDWNDQSWFTVDVTYNHQFIVASIFGMGSIQLSADSTDMFWRGES
ncbi:MAG TPA: TadE/TadG family type IV pilus assembly protein [Thermomicrobiales bacterium]|nr:TadE/TadG family type IV pilus assembly protein [Thermomicrobiales bacterium]